jgi:hypothetical protein
MTVATHELDQCWAQYKLWQCQERGPGGVGATATAHGRRECCGGRKGHARTLAPPLPCLSWRRTYAVRPPTAPPPRCGRGMAAVSLARPRSVATRSRQPPPQPPLNSMRARARACQCDASRTGPAKGSRPSARPSPSIQIPSKTKRTRAFPRPSPFHQVSP